MTAATRHAQPLLEAGNRHGEGVLWCPRTRTLFWTDIAAATLWSYRPRDGATRHWDMPERLASFALCEADGWLLLGLASRLAFFHLDTGDVVPLQPVEPDLPTRVNDGACDRQGRFVFGTMHEPADGGAQQAVGSFYRLHADLVLERLPLQRVAIANSVAFSADGTRMYYCDSSTRRICCCDYGADGQVGKARVFVDLGAVDGEPDGSAVDAEGGLWNAQWGMARVVRYRADGGLDAVVDVAARQPSRVAIGGEGLDTLYITSARVGLSAEALAGDPLAGAVFAAPAGVRGVAEPRFMGVPPAH